MVWDFLLVTSQRKHGFEFLTQFNLAWALIQWAVFMTQTFVGNCTIIRVFIALD